MHLHPNLNDAPMYNVHTAYSGQWSPNISLLTLHLLSTQ